MFRNDPQPQSSAPQMVGAPQVVSAPQVVMHTVNTAAGAPARPVGVVAAGVHPAAGIMTPSQAQAQVIASTPARVCVFRFLTGSRVFM